MKNTALRAIAFVVAILAGAHAGAAETGDSYAVVSTVGDAISVVRYQPTTGSNVDQNSRLRVPTTDRHFDELATRVAVDTIRRTVPDATVVGVRLVDDAPFADGDTFDAVDAALPSLVATVRPLLAQPQPHYLVVIAKFRGDARLRVNTGTIGSGKLAGIGIYLDPFTRMRGRGRELGRGFIAPYAYIQVILVDLRSGTVVRRETAETSATRANIGDDATLDPWDVLTAEQKTRLLNGTLIRAVQSAVPRVTAPM